MASSRVLLTTEGSYPYFVGGVSTWCDYLLKGLPDYQFEVMALLGPRPAPALAMALPNNVKALKALHIWRPRKGKPASAAVRGRFLQALERLLAFAYEDPAEFSQGLLELVQLGDTYDLWPLFEQNAAVHLLRRSLAVVVADLPVVAEAVMAAHWLRAIVVPVAFTPPPTDLVHSVVNGLAAIPAWAASKQHGTPLLITEHGLYLRERYLGLSAEATPHSLKRFQALFYRTLARTLYAQASKVSAVLGFRPFWQQDLGVTAQQMRVVYNGVSPEAFPPTAYKITPNPTLVWVGRIDPLKDLATLIRAFAELKKQVPEATLRLFGPVPKGNEAYKASLNALIADLKVEGIRFEGPISPSAQAYQNADLFVLSSVSEGFPYVLVEAMFSGVPVVATRVGGVPEVLDGGRVGRLVPPQNPTALANGMLEVLQDPLHRKNMALLARNHALQNLTLSQMQEAYRDLYHQLQYPWSQPAKQLAEDGIAWAEPTLQPAMPLQPIQDAND